MNKLLLLKSEAVMMLPTDFDKMFMIRQTILVMFLSTQVAYCQVDDESAKQKLNNVQIRHGDSARFISKIDSSLALSRINKQVEEQDFLSKYGEWLVPSKDEELPMRLLPFWDEMLAQLNDIVERISKEMSPDFKIR